jgi:hypothetical protein
LEVAISWETLISIYQTVHGFSYQELWSHAREGRVGER